MAEEVEPRNRIGRQVRLQDNHGALLAPVIVLRRAAPAADMGNRLYRQGRHDKSLSVSTPPDPRQKALR